MEPLGFCFAGSGCCCIGAWDLLMLSLVAAHSRSVAAGWLAVGYAAAKGAVVLYFWGTAEPPADPEEALIDAPTLFGWLASSWAVGAVSAAASLVWVLLRRRQSLPNSYAVPKDPPPAG